VNISYPPRLNRLPLHKARLEAICLAAMREQRVVAMTIWGSFARGTADWYSDLDLGLVSEDDDVQHVSRTAREIAESSGPVVAAYPGEHFGEPDMVTVLYEDLIHLDLTAIGLSAFAARRLPADFMLWERKELSSLVGRAGEDVEEQEIPPGDLGGMDQKMWTWVWYAQSKILRGEVWEAYDSINYMRTFVLFPLVRVTEGVSSAEGSRWIDELIGDRREDFARTLPAPDRKAALDALRQTVRLYLDLVDPLLAKYCVEPAAAARRAVGKALEDGLEWQPPQ
jgi:predicted nucleotidyltransferase